eukprot:GHVQ01010077.1.p1 GENE.GHVQ01010077.1~~GHVQ01010077.1.p1  ORF type:complete len:161 (-),score=15.82 GHVQ01010077.1:144-569(-)
MAATTAPYVTTELPTSTVADSSVPTTLTNMLGDTSAAEWAGLSTNTSMFGATSTAECAGLSTNTSMFGATSTAEWAGPTTNMLGDTSAAEWAVCMFYSSAKVWQWWNRQRLGNARGVGTLEAVIVPLMEKPNPEESPQGLV